MNYKELNETREPLRAFFSEYLTLIHLSAICEFKRDFKEVTLVFHFNEGVRMNEYSITTEYPKMTLLNILVEFGLGVSAPINHNHSNEFQFHYFGRKEEEKKTGSDLYIEFQFRTLWHSNGLVNGTKYNHHNNKRSDDEIWSISCSLTAHERTKRIK